MYLWQQGTGKSAVTSIWHGCKTSEEKKSSQSNLLGAEWPLNEFKLWEQHFPSCGISHHVPSGGHAAVGVQLGFLLLVSMFSTEEGFLKGPSVQQMLCSDVLCERGAVVGSDPIVGPWRGAAWLWCCSFLVELQLCCSLGLSSVGCLRSLWAPHCISKGTHRKD